MLQNLRDLSKHWIFKGLMAFLVLSFGIWGIGDMFRGNPQQRAVANVGKVAITVQELEHEFQKDLPEARRVFGPDLTVPKARQIGVLDRTLNIMIEHASFDQELKRLGMAIDDKPILEKIASLKELRDKDGKFNVQMWHQLLAKSGYSEKGFLESERRNAARRILLNTLLNETPVPQVLLGNLYRARGAKRILEVLTIRNDSMKDLDPPDEEKLKAFHDEHGDLFTAPEYRSLTVAMLSEANLAADIAINDDDLKQAYEARPDDVTLPETRDFIQVIVQDENKAKALAETAHKDGSLTEAAKAQNMKPIELNAVDEKNVLPELYTTLFALNENDISDPVKSGFGWHVVQLKKIHAGGKIPFDEAKDKIRDLLKRERSADALARVVNQLDDALAGGRPLEDIADSLKLRLLKVEAVDKDGVDPDGNKPLDVPGKEDVLSTAFGLAAGETSAVIDDKKGNYLVVRTDEVKPAHVVPYEQVMQETFDAWKRTQQAEKAADKATEIAKQLREGAKSLSFASKTGIDVRFSKPVSMLGDVDPEIPSQAFAKILEMKKDDVITTAGTDKQFVLRLADVVPVDPDHPDSGMAKITSELHERMPYEMVDEYSRFLHRRFPVTTNEALLDTLRKQGS